MPRKSTALATCLVTSLLGSACSERVVAPPAATPSTSAPLRSEALLAGTGARLIFDGSRMPTASRLDDLGAGTVERLIDPKSYVCSTDSPINRWLNTRLTRTLATESDNFFTLYDLAADEVPTYEALLFQTSSMPQSYGYTGEFTKVLQKTERDVKRFWDIPSDDIQVVAMHGSVLLDVERVAATYEAVYGLSRSSALAYANVVRSTLLGSTTMDGNYPFWTFNAVSFSTPSHSIPDKIVMGDGLLEGYASVGYGDVAPQAIFAHEFGHQIQYENGYALPASVSAPERTRYSELMADAFSAYYLTHARGAAMNQKRVEEFLSVFFQIGDCSFKSSGHHGTPNQRLASARFGFAVADEAQKQGHIMSAAEFHARFDAQYPTIIAPDAH